MIKVPGWDCADGTDDEDHDWKLVSDWYGDPNVINGTADCSYYECRQCGKRQSDEPAGFYDGPDEDALRERAQERA